MTYFVIAYRWGCVNTHHYFVYCGQDRTKAEALAQAECADRGGKYGCAVYEFNADGTDYRLVAYNGASMNNEKEPFHNHRIDFFQTLGHKFARFAEGFSTHVEPHSTLNNKDGEPMMVVKERPVEVPLWVKEEYDRAAAVLNVMEHAMRRDEGERSE